MITIETPKANPENLLSIIREAHNGKVVVPEFQRSFVWGREDVEELLVSILEGYFVGTFLLLDTMTRRPMFPFRAVEGVESVNPQVSPESHETVRLALDGQQRITSLFYALYEPDAPLRWARYPHRFFLRLDAALDGDIEEAVEGISTRDRRRMSEMQQLVDAELAIPMTRFRDSSEFYPWLYNEQKAWPDDESRSRIVALYNRMSSFMVPVVALSPSTGRDNIVNIFERINRTGVGLSLFDLAGARLYLKKVMLRDLWDEFQKNIPETAKWVKPEFLLKVVALLQGKEPRKRTLLDVIDDLDKPAFESRWYQAAEAIAQAHDRMTKRYGALTSDWIPFSTMVVPLAALLHHLQQSHAGEDAYRKLDRWYWASVFSQRYDSAVDTKSYQDARDIRRWFEDGSAPDWLQRIGVGDVDLDISESRSAVYRGLMCLIVLQGAKDFLTGQSANLNECQDDHVFPKSVYGKKHLVDSILNRTLISKESNGAKSNKHPSKFMEVCLTHHGGDEPRLLQTLRSHFISEEGYLGLLADDYDTFVSARKGMLQPAVQMLLTQGEVHVAARH